MNKYNYPTTIYFGEGALEASAKTIAETFKKPLMVTDKTLVDLGLADQVKDIFSEAGLDVVVFADVQSNPTEDDVDNGAKVYNDNNCDCLIGFGGGSPMDAAKVIAVRATQKGPMAKFDDALGGDSLMDGSKLPANFAIPTTAGTGSEVGRAGVITVKETGRKTIIFHPKLMPTIAILEPRLTEKLPAGVTAATGIDAFTHLMEAWLAPGFHPMADGIALEGMHLVLENLGTCYNKGSDLEARGKMMIAASMGATAFQKGLGMIHAIAHPLSSECGLHHGLANAVMLPTCVEFLENASLNDEQRGRLSKVNGLFKAHGLPAEEKLSATCRNYFESLGIQFGLKNHGVKESDFTNLAQKAFMDVSHQTNMIPVTEADLLETIKRAF